MGLPGSFALVNKVGRVWGPPTVNMCMSSSSGSTVSVNIDFFVQRGRLPDYPYTADLTLRGGNAQV